MSFDVIKTNVTKANLSVPRAFGLMQRGSMK